MMKRLMNEHVLELSRFHAQNLSGKLTGLGAAYIQFFYSTALRLDDTIAWAFFEGSAMAGFVMGNARPQNFLSRLIRQNSAGWLWACLCSAVTHPLAFARVILSLRAPKPGIAPSTDPEVYFIAVGPEQRGKKIGSQLIRQFCQDLSERGSPRFELSVGDDNPNAIRFYEKLGGQPLGNYQAAGFLLTRFSFPVPETLDKARTA